MHYTFVVNPAAGRHRAGRRYRTLLALLERNAFDYEVVATERPGHAVELAREAAGRSEVVVAVGGDGTIQEVAAGILEAGRRVHLGVLPLGSGNDFIKMIGMPRSMPAALDALKRAVPTPVDYGIVRCRQNGWSRENIFVNIVGIGFDAQVAAEVVSHKRLPGIAGYLAAVFTTLSRWRAPVVHIEACPHGGPGTRLFDGPFFLTTAGNGRSSGGGFLLTPGADIRDGQLDLCVIRGIKPGRVLQLLPQTLWGGHINAPEVQVFREPVVHIGSDEDLPVHADGEIIAASARLIEIQTVKGGLSVLFPTRP